MISKFSQIFLIKTILFFIILTTSEIYAKETKLKSETTTITSKYIDIKRKSQKIEFLENVVVKNASDMMTSEKMTVFYEESENNKENQNNKIDKIVSENNVKLFTADFVASSDQGYYNPNKEIFVLEKNVVVNNSDSIGTGDKFIYDLKTRKGNFIGNQKNIDGDSRVIFVIDKNSENLKKNKK